MSDDADDLPDLPLFSWTAPVRVLLFPPRLEVARVRKTAKALATSRSDREQAARWRQIIDGVQGRLERAGFSAQTVEAECLAFAAAVSAELARSWYGPADGGDGAA